MFYIIVNINIKNVVCAIITIKMATVKHIIVNKKNNSRIIPGYLTIMMKTMIIILSVRLPS